MIRTIAILLLLGLASPLRADDWPQFLGPTRNGVSQEKAIIAAWSKSGPKRLWERDVGEGFGGPVVAEGRVVLHHRVGGDEVVECFDAGTGKPLWKHADACPYDDPLNKGNGPRSTPLIRAGRVVTLGVAGKLLCLKLADGSKIWQRELHQDFRVPPSYFGVGTSPLEVDGLILVNVGAKGAGIIAVSADTGRDVWKATDDGPSYSSPVLAEVAGKRCAIFLTRLGVVVLDPANGAVHYTQRWRARNDASVNAATPLVIGDLVFFSASYDTGALLLRLTKDGAQEVWQSDEVMSNHYNTCILRAGYLYGFHGRQETGPSFRCVDLKTQKVMWDRERFGCGTMVLAGDRLIVLTEQGELILAEPTPTAYRELARARIFEGGPVRAQIALADGRLFARGARKLVCLTIGR